MPVSAPPTGLDECLFFISLVSDFLAIRLSVSSGCARRRSVSTYAANFVLSSTQITFVLLCCARNLSSLLCLPAMISSKIPKFASAFGDAKETGELVLYFLLLGQRESFLMPTGHSEGTVLYNSSPACFFFLFLSILFSFLFPRPQRVKGVTR